jgi:LPXTG-motif cell wall-anchored protein
MNHSMKKMMLMLFAAATLLLAPVGVAHATTPATVEVTWLLPEGSVPVPYSDPRGDGFNVPEGAYPQTIHEGTVPCERWVQIDTYTSEDAATYTADGLLYYGEDWDGVLAWRFVYGGECEETPVDVCPNIDGVQESVPEGHILDDDECLLIPPIEEEPPVEAEKPPHLAETGPTDVVVWLGVAGLLAASGIILLIRSRKRA